LPAKVNGLKIDRKFTKTGKDPFQKLKWEKRDVEIRNFDGSTAFSMKDVNLPDNYSQVAANVLAQKYLRKAGVPKKLKKVKEPDVPIWLQKSVPDSKSTSLGEEIDGKQTFRRLAGTWTYWGWKYGILPVRRTLVLTMMRCVICWLSKWFLQILHNGSTPV